MATTNRRLGKHAIDRKAVPIYSGFIKYFPDAIIEVTKQSVKGMSQHSTPTWNKDVSKDELDALMRHLIEGDFAAVAWRAMANLQRQCEEEDKQLEEQYYLDI
tara:strand:- start:427 stop:735 length:309 start_codon:yes stop_codon:yes gene_type:complete